MHIHLASVALEKQRRKNKMETLFLFMRLLNDLHISPGDFSNQDHIAKINQWIHSEQGVKVIGDIDQLLNAKGIDIQIAITKR